MNPCIFHLRRSAHAGPTLAGPLLAVLCLLGSPPASAQIVSGRLSTSFYTWERYDTVDVSRLYLRAFQTVQLNVTQDAVSLHSYLTGAIATPGEAAAVRAYNLYLRWANVGKFVDLSAGRQAVYAGVGTGTIDGLAAKFRFLDNGVTVLGYAGAAPAIGYRGIRSNFHDNLSVGGQIITTLLSDARISLSYLNRKEERDPYWALRARDTSFAPVPYYVTFEPDAYQLLGADVSYDYGGQVSVYGRYDHDLNQEKAARVQGDVRVCVTPEVGLTLGYMYRLPRISYNSIFSAFVQNAVDEIEGGVEYEFSPRVRGYVRLGSVKYSDERSTRWSLGVATGFGTASYTGGNGYAGEIRSFSVQGVYPVDENRIVPSAGIAYTTYRLNSNEEIRDAFSLVAGGTCRPLPSLSIDLQAQFLANRIYASALNGFVRVNYWFREKLNLFEQEVVQ
jgi:hypothetical protein